MGLSYNGWTKEKLIAFEEDIEKHFLNGEIRAPVHFSRGNEEALVDIFVQNDIGNGKNWCFSTHRNHYHALLHGIPPDWLKEQILAGRSMHINSWKHKFMTSSIVNGCVPIAVGVAMALKRQNSLDKVWCFIGDMAESVGAFYENSKYAAKNALPITFVVEDNGLSTNTPTEEAWGHLTLHHNVITYQYVRDCPHINVGKWVTFK